MSSHQKENFSIFVGKIYGDTGDTRFWSINFQFLPKFENISLHWKTNDSATYNNLATHMTAKGSSI